jgi:hypothetical protein
MRTSLTFQTEDYAGIRGVFLTLSESVMRSVAVAGAGWLRWLEAKESLGDIPPFSQDLSRPTCWGRYQVVYDEAAQTSCEGDLGAVTTRGRIICWLRYQPNTPEGVNLAIVAKLKDAFVTASVEDMAFFVNEPSRPGAPYQSFYTEEIPIRFRGGVRRPGG